MAQTDQDNESLDTYVHKCLEECLADACAARDALARECSQLEEDREYNASLVEERDKMIAKLQEHLAALDAAEAALADCGIGGIYDDFTGLADAIEQMTQYIDELTREDRRRTGQVEALQAERQLRQEAEHCHEAALTMARNRATRLEIAERHAESLRQEFVGIQEALDECQVPHNYDDGEPASARTRIFWLNQRGEDLHTMLYEIGAYDESIPNAQTRTRAEALAQLVTPELATLLERLADYARQAAYAAKGCPDDVDGAYNDEEITRALAAKIREALDDSQA